MNRYSFSSNDELNNHLCFECKKAKCNCDRINKLKMLQALSDNGMISFSSHQLNVLKLLDEARNE